MGRFHPKSATIGVTYLSDAGAINAHLTASAASMSVVFLLKSSSRFSSSMNTGTNESLRTNGADSVWANSESAARTSAPE